MTDPANTRHLYSICTMLDQRRSRWADVVQMLYKCFVFAGEDVPSKHETMIQCLFNVGPTSDTVGQHRSDIGKTVDQMLGHRLRRGPASNQHCSKPLVCWGRLGDDNV